MLPNSTTGTDSPELEGRDEQLDFSGVTVAVGSGRPNRVSLAALIVSAAEPLKFVLNGLIPWGTVIVLAGEAKKARKTWFAMAVALAVARGDSFIGRATVRMPVVYAFLEDGRRRAALRWRMLGARGDESIRLEAVFGPRDALRLIEELRARGEKVFLIIDPLVVLLAHTGVKDENAALEIEKCIALLRELVRETESTVLLTHHMRKAGDRMRGSVAIEGSTDGWLELKRNKDGTADLTGTLRDCDGPEQCVRFVIENDGAGLEDAGRHVERTRERENASPTESAALAAMRIDPGRDWREGELIKRVGAGRGAVRGALERLVKSGAAVKAGEGVYRVAANREPAANAPPEAQPPGGKKTKKAPRGAAHAVELE